MAKTKCPTHKKVMRKGRSNIGKDILICEECEKEKKKKQFQKKLSNK